MTPPTRILWGLVLIVFDFRIDGLDLVPDLLGWLVIVWGIVPLRDRSGWFDLAMVGAALGALLSIPQLVSAPGPELTMVESLAMTALVFGTCSGIATLVDEASVVRTATVIRWLDLGLTAVLVLATGLERTVSVWTVSWVLPVGLLALVVFIWFAVFLFTLRRHPALQERQHATP